jgi:hypothetical protein
MSPDSACLPVPVAPPVLGPHTRANWAQISSGHGASWHDGRLHALATTALAPGSTYAGAWSIPVRVDGRPTAISGGVRFAPDPSLSGSGRSSLSPACWPGCACAALSSIGYFVIALAAVWEGASLVGVLTHGFVLIALPALLTRIAVALCLGTGAALLPVIFRLAEWPERGRAAQPAGASHSEDDEAWDEEL